jgi:CheY-like chemotaxis protein
MRAVLVVEDDQDVAESIGEALQQSGHRTRVASDGEEALARLDEMTRPCLLLVDWVMPVMDGHALVHEVARREDSDQLPVIVMSAQPDVERALTWPGVRGVLKKPFGVAEVLAAIEKYCGNG